MLIVLDTNVVVSGLLTETGNPGKVLDLILDGRVQVAYDDRILGEYEDVLARPEFHLNPTQVKAVIAQIELAGKWTEANPVSMEGPVDPGDLPFVEVFISSNADAMVTGNIRHFLPLLEKGLRVLTPTQFIDQYYPE